LSISSEGRMVYKTKKHQMKMKLKLRKLRK
jgi:hypothetical protein